MKKLYVIKPVGETPNFRLDNILREIFSLEIVSAEIWERAEQLRPIHGAHILFAVDLGESGVNPEWCRMLTKIRLDTGFFEGSVGAAIVDGKTELFTKTAGRELVFSANMSGCLFPGRPLVEATGSLRNFEVTARNLRTDLPGAYLESSRDLLCRLMCFSPPRHERPRILVLHASIYETSNTLSLWDMVKRHLVDCMDIQEISLRNGQVYDCGGCPYPACLHFSERGKCYYGGVIVEQVYPAVEECDALVMLCPNYNDALSANLCAFINRLTSLYRRRQFFDKYLFGIVVSGYSGGDILAEQLIGGLNMNKTFILPSRFALMETANDPGSIACEEEIPARAEGFAAMIKTQLLGKPQ